MKTVALLRHAKTETGSATIQDHARSLTQRGLADAAQMGRWLQERGLRPDLVLCSTAARTCQTLNEINATHPGALPAAMDDRLYLASAADMMKRLQELPDTVSHVMVIGHNPGLHELCVRLTGSGDPRAMKWVEVAFPTCAIAVLRCDVQSWAELGEADGYLEMYYCPNEAA